MEEKVHHYPSCPLMWGKMEITISIRLLPPPVVIAIFSGSGSARWRQFFLFPHQRSMLHAAAGTNNDSNQNQMAAIPRDDGPQPPTSPPPPSLMSDCCILVFVASPMDVKRERDDHIKANKGVNLLLPSAPPPAPQRRIKGERHAEEDLDHHHHSNGGWRRR
jgi:hypothetical protein